ncbi:MAG: ABC transporter ATP-binding protein [Chlorobiaceae bacterium]|jgi:iron complex transport system ATP-binding protein|nr:ABC transporter ATP-binding protein [Chlorobiaceae bacterium]
MNNNVLTFESVSSGYKHRPVLHDISFSVAEGEFISLIGPNGCGKSTLLKTASALIHPASGKVTLFGQDVKKLKPVQRAAMIGVVPQKIESPMAFSVGQIVMNGRISSMNRWGSPGARDYDIAERAMIYTDVLDLRDRYFTELSGGEQQRVALAMVLAQEPGIIMLDESISHLDINHRQEVLQILMNINREKQITVLFVSHDLSLSAEISDRLLLLSDGRLVASGTPCEVLQAEQLSRVYNCSLQVLQDPYTGSLQVSSAMSSRRHPNPLNRIVHVIAGGGSGIELYRRLLLAGYGVTTGVLNRLDSDAEAARALNLHAVLEEPFSPIGAEPLNAARSLMHKADYLILGRVPFGPGNLVNLQLAEEALAKMKPVFIADGMNERDYSPGKTAVLKTGELHARGAQRWGTLNELMALLAQAEKRFLEHNH